MANDLLAKNKTTNQNCDSDEPTRFRGNGMTQPPGTSDGTSLTKLVVRPAAGFRTAGPAPLTPGPAVRNPCLSARSQSRYSPHQRSASESYSNASRLKQTSYVNFFNGPGSGTNEIRPPSGDVLARYPR